MDKSIYNILDNVNEGIVILDNNLDIQIWNSYMETISNKNIQEVIGRKIYEILPGLDKSYFKKSIQEALQCGRKMFFSAAMHKNLVDCKEELDINLNISKFDQEGSSYVLLEFINVTNQFVQINQLKNYLNELYRVNGELRNKERVIKELAYYDNLTGVANRVLFYKVAEKYLKKAKKNKEIMGLMFIDVNKFKNINDMYGHELGDQILKKVADILVNATKPDDIVARYGGDEFLILLPNIKNWDNYKIIFNRIVNTKNQMIDVGGKKIDITLSVGVSFYPEDGEMIDRLIGKADHAMYIAKKGIHKDNCVCYIS